MLAKEKSGELNLSSRKDRPMSATARMISHLIFALIRG